MKQKDVTKEDKHAKNLCFNRKLEKHKRTLMFDQKVKKSKKTKTATTGHGHIYCAQPQPQPQPQLHDKITNSKSHKHIFKQSLNIIQNQEVNRLYEKRLVFWETHLPSGLQRS